MINKKNTYIIIVYLLFLGISKYSQSQTSEIKGYVTEKGSNEIIPGANVFIEGTTTGTSSDFNGFYSIKNLKAGTYNIKVTFISYKSQVIENVTINEGDIKEINFELETEAQLLKAIEVEARILRDRENILLLEQMKSSEMIQQIGAQEISRKGISDVASAVSKVSGISKQEGDNMIYVRGLGDRYNSTSLNGLPIPSNNPEQKNVSLDIFSIDIVEYISIDKVYNNKIYGDFAGGNVDINSKDFNGDRFFEIGIGSNINTSSIDEKLFSLKEGPNYFGLNTLVAPTTISEYAFENSLESASMTPIGQSFSLSTGNMKRMGLEREMNYFITLNFGNEFTSKDGIAKSVNNTGYTYKDLRMKSYDYSTNTTGMLNLGFKINKNNKLNFNVLFINSSNNSNEIYEGTIIDIANEDNGLLSRKTYEKNTIIVNQLLGNHKFGQKSEFNWGVSYNTISSDLPDRLQNTFVQQKDGNYVFGQNQITDNHRYFHFLNENEKAANLSYSYKILTDTEYEYKVKFTLGSSTRYKVRDFNATQYNFRIHTDQRGTIVEPDNLSQFFNQENLAKGNFFRIETFRGNHQVPFALDPQVYGGTQFIQAGYLTTEYNFNSKFLAIIGLRAESVSQLVEWNTQLDPRDKKDFLDLFAFLPNITTRYKINNKQNLRFGASKTYTLPQFKERAMFIYEEVTQVKLGNPDLYQSDNYNADLKWEFFPSLGEVISVGAFGKYIINPINEVFIASATNDISFLNTGNWGYVGGVELEIKKTILEHEKSKSKLYAGFNTTYMTTEQELNKDKIEKETIYMVYFTEEKTNFTGASDLLINADITYQKELKKNNEIMTTVSYNYFSDKIYAIGTNDAGNIIDKGFSTLNLIIKANINKFSMGINFKNVLNPSIESFQANKNADVVVLSYKKGINIGFSLNYKF